MTYKKVSIQSGISMNADGSFNFDWKTDNKDTDILWLAENTSGSFLNGLLGLKM